MNTKLFVGLASAALLIGCGSGGDNNTDNNGNNINNGKSDEVNGPGVCNSEAVDHSFFDQGEDFLENHTDAFAIRALRLGDSEDDCPLTFTEVFEKLQETDTGGCDSDSHIISEESAVQGGADASFRILETRACDDREKHEMIFSIFGLFPGNPPPETPLEVIAFDDATGVFNYWVREDGEWQSHGSSRDFLERQGANQFGAVQNEEADNDTARCGQCHTGGGLLMKERNSPWLNWNNGSTEAAGSKEMVAEFEHLGDAASGQGFEKVVTNGNKVWNEVRVADLKETADVQDLLLHLFCTGEINIDAGNMTSSGVNINNDFLFDITLSDGNTSLGAFKDKSLFKVSETAYDAAVEATGQQLLGNNGRQLGDLVDTINAFAYPERSIDDIDYVQQLIAQEVITEEFAKDVLLVDFTRPVFSPDRCDLMAFVPPADGNELTADEITAAFIEELEADNPAEGSAAAQLLANLTEDDTDHAGTVKTFVDACKARDKAEFMEDANRIAGLRREQSRSMAVLEFLPSMPSNNHGLSANAKFDPVTCEIVE